MELFASGVVLPVRPGDAHQLERPDPAGVRDMRPTAQIDELALAIEAEGRVLLQVVVDVFDLELLLHVLHERPAFGNGTLEAFEWFRVFDDLPHLLLDAREVFFANRSRRMDVVIEAVFERRAERELHAGKQPADGAGHDMRAAVAEDIERLGVFLGEDLQGVFAGGKFGHEIDDVAVELGGERVLGEAFADRFGDLFAGGAGGVFFGRAVGEFDGEHERRNPKNEDARETALAGPGFGACVKIMV